MNYLTLLSDLRDSVLYIEILFSPSACAVCLYHVLFVCSVWYESTVTQWQLVRQRVTRRPEAVFPPRGPPTLDSILNYSFVTSFLPDTSRLDKECA